MSQIKNYGVCVEYSPEDLAKTVTKAIAEGFQPIGGVALTREPGTAKAGSTGRNVYAQAVIRLYTPQDAAGQIVTKVINGRG